MLLFLASFFLSIASQGMLATGRESASTIISLIKVSISLNPTYKIDDDVLAMFVYRQNRNDHKILAQLIAAYSKFDAKKAQLYPSL